MRLVRALSTAAALVVLSAGTADAQLAIQSLTINSHPLKTQVAGFPGQGGAFQITSIPDLGTFLAYCIDSGRSIGIGATYTDYTLYNFAQYVSAAIAPNQVDVLDLNFIAKKVEGYDLTKPGPNDVGNNAIQEAIWKTYSGAISNLDPTITPSGNWGVLANGVNQTFLVRLADPNIVVPEPSTYALMAVGLVGLFAATRRRRVA